MPNFIKLGLAGAASLAFLSGCGGGGGDSPAAAAVPATASSQAALPTTFPLLVGYKAYLAAGQPTETFTISGTCTGLAAVSRSAPSAAVFEGAAAQAVATTIIGQFNNCSPASVAATSTGYYDSNYNPLGHVAIGVAYGQFITAPQPLPVAVKVGDTGTYGAEAIYTDSGKRTVIGQRALSYVIEADGGSTSSAIVNLIAKDFDTANRLLFTQQTKYRIGTDGTLSTVLIDVQYSTTSENHLVYTK